MAMEPVVPQVDYKPDYSNGQAGVDQNIMIRGLPPCDISSLQTCELAEIVHDYKRLLSFGSVGQKKQTYFRLLEEKRKQSLRKQERMMAQGRITPEESESEEKTDADKLGTDWSFLEYLRKKMSAKDERSDRNNAVVLPDGVDFVMPIAYDMRNTLDGLLVRLYHNEAELAVERLGSDEFRVLSACEKSVWLQRFCDALRHDLTIYLKDVHDRAVKDGETPDYYGRIS